MVDPQARSAPPGSLRHLIFLEAPRREGLHAYGGHVEQALGASCSAPVRLGWCLGRGVEQRLRPTVATKRGGFNIMWQHMECTIKVSKYEQYKAFVVYAQFLSGLLALLSRTWRGVVIGDSQARINCMTHYHPEIISACDRAYAQVGGQIMLNYPPARAEVESLTQVGGTEQARHTLAGVRHQLHPTSPRLSHG